MSQTIEVNGRPVEVHEKSVFHALGPTSDFALDRNGFFGPEYYYNYTQEQAAKEGKSLYAYLEGMYGSEEVKEVFEEEDDLNAYDLFDMLKDYEGINEIYDNAVIHKVQTDTAILPGDLVYQFPTWYPTREYYGISLVSLDGEGKKILNGYGDGLSFDPITGELLKKLLEINKKYFDDADVQLWNYLSLDAIGTTQQEVNAVVSRMKGGKRRKTLRRRKQKQQKRKHTRKH